MQKFYKYMNVYTYIYRVLMLPTHYSTRMSKIQSAYPLNTIAEKYCLSVSMNNLHLNYTSNGSYANSK